MDRLEPKRLVRFSALTFFVTLSSAVVFCFGCSMHEMDRQGPEDFITFLLAGGTYLSLFLMFAAIGGLVVGLIADKHSSGRSSRKKPTT
jgi:hypothetical protein